MKNILSSLTVLFSLSACASGPIYQSPQESVVVSEEPVYGTPYDRLLDNVRIKQADAFGITYEYKDVRVDEIAFLAAQYCFEQKGKQAYLYDSQLYKNFSRRATFHCVELQN